MKCQFSESQYCLGLGRELLEVLNPAIGWGAPYLPTQRDEAHSGYDFSLSGPINTLFIQFKVPDKLTRRNANYWDCFNGPYYRTSIMKLTDSNQHNLLVDLANQDSRNHVIYGAPIFHEQSEFNEYYSSNSIMEKSIAIDCSSLNRITDDLQHYFAYDEDPNRCFMFSEPKEVKGEVLREYISKAQESEPYDGIEDVIESITEYIPQNLGKKELNLERIEEPQGKIAAISEYLAIQKNIFMYLF